ncbi:helix-turn-helix domain-containing protein [Tepidiforma sp.]|uniref:winged helix-turn-helix transcriptional regulator n=1 Tax=Tepidiforma sp. TaxID=2682230 RepID=UPI002ADE1B44|nr:helix-turn-helix domain-containing protein [Tepidiforma sp.]
MSDTVRCPIAWSLGLVGDHWTLLIVRDLLRGIRRFNHLRESVEGVPPAVLSARLRALEEAGVVERRQYQDRPARFEYRLTPKGHALGVVVGALADWGQRYGEADLALVDGECGHGISVVYHCPTCAREAPRRRVRIVGRRPGGLPGAGAASTLPG